MVGHPQINGKVRVIGGAKMEDKTCNAMIAAGGKGNVRNKFGEHCGSGCRLSAEFVIERENGGIGVMILLVG